MVSHDPVSTLEVETPVSQGSDLKMENIREKVRREIDEEVSRALIAIDQNKGLYNPNPFNTQTHVDKPTPEEDNNNVILGMSEPLDDVSCQSSPSPRPAIEPIQEVDESNYKQGSPTPKAKAAPRSLLSHFHAMANHVPK